MSPDGVLEVGKEVSISREKVFSTVPLCSCGPNTHSSYAHGKHRFPLLLTDSERTERGQESVYFFNESRMKIERLDRSYNQELFRNSHGCIMLMLGLIVGDVLFSMRQHELWRVQENKDHARKNEKEADDFNLDHGGATFIGMGYIDDGKKDKVEGLDMMVHLAASFYLVAFQLVHMAQGSKGENLEKELLEERNIQRKTFEENKWKDKKGDLCQPGTKKMKNCLLMIKEDLIVPVIDQLSDIKSDLEDKMDQIISLEQDSCETGVEYQELFALRSRFRNVCVRTAVMLEIAAKYLIYMSRGKDAPFYNIDLFRGEDELLQKFEDWECKICGNTRLVENNDLSE